MVVVMETETPIDILNNWMFWETLINTNLVAPAAVSGTLIQSNSSFDCLNFPSSGRSDSASLDGTFMDYICSSLCWWS